MQQTFFDEARHIPNSAMKLSCSSEWSFEEKISQILAISFSSFSAFRRLQKGRKTSSCNGNMSFGQACITSSSWTTTVIVSSLCDFKKPKNSRETFSRINYSILYSYRIKLVEAVLSLCPAFFISNESIFSKKCIFNLAFQFVLNHVKVFLNIYLFMLHNDVT